MPDKIDLSSSPEPNFGKEEISAADSENSNSLPLVKFFDNNLNGRSNEKGLQLLAQELALRKDEDKHLWRKDYLQKSFYLVGFALYFTFTIIVLSSVGLIDISQTVLVTLMGSTVAEVIGILIVAFNWLYPHARESKAPQKRTGKGM